MVEVVEAFTDTPLLAVIRSVLLGLAVGGGVYWVGSLVRRSIAENVRAVEDGRVEDEVVVRVDRREGERGDPPCSLYRVRDPLHNAFLLDRIADALRRAFHRHPVAKL